jgi:hypothetical protein
MDGYAKFVMQLAKHPEAQDELLAALPFEDLAAWQDWFRARD